MKNLLCFILVLSSSYNALADTAFEATQRIAGTYKGAWTMSGINSDGAIVDKLKWTDLVVATNPQQISGRSIIDVHSVMTYENGQTREAKFREGYFARLDGSLGNRFFEDRGVITEYSLLSSGVWTFTSAVAEYELKFLGFEPKDVTSAVHVTVKVLAGYAPEVQSITRVTTVNYKSKDGSSKVIQFVSMKGTHQKTQ